MRTFRRHEPPVAARADAVAMDPAAAAAADAEAGKLGWQLAWFGCSSIGALGWRQHPRPLQWRHAYTQCKWSLETDYTMGCHAPKTAL